MKYIVSYHHPHRHFIDIEFVIDNVNTPELTVQLPAWRPGRYELGNFARNIQQLKVTDEKGAFVPFRKTAKDTWLVSCAGVKKLHVHYNYYAAELNAGSTYLDEKQLYINPVNCCLYVPERINEPCLFELKIPLDYQVATGMEKDKDSPLLIVEQVKSIIYKAPDFNVLADSPLIASNSLQHNMFVMDGVEFHLWFQGDCQPKWSQLVNDFFIFINEQMMMMREFPCEIYHFLFQALPFKFHHGVEHLNSTVIALGPAHKLMGGEPYNDLLGVSSHELFHAWNIKSIRPVEMMPYDYTRENYSRLGYVYEGVTTYYGDLLLFRSGVFSEYEYIKTVRERLQKHFHNPARLTMPVSEASFDTWLDGYIMGIPGRKTNIYDEGAVLAFVTDMLIRKYSNNEKSLDDVMRFLYQEFAKKGKGYADADYIGIAEHMADQSLKDFFEKYVYGAADIESLLKECLAYIGCELLTSKSKRYYESGWGIKLIEGTGKISTIYPNSPADIAGLAVNDEIISVNGTPVKNDLTEWSRHYAGKQVELVASSVFGTKVLKLSPDTQSYYNNYVIGRLHDATEAQRNNYKLWSKRSF